MAYFYAFHLSVCLTNILHCWPAFWPKNFPQFQWSPWTTCLMSTSSILDIFVKIHIIGVRIGNVLQDPCLGKGAEAAGSYMPQRKCRNIGARPPWVLENQSWVNSRLTWEVFKKWHLDSASEILGFTWSWMGPGYLHFQALSRGFQWTVFKNHYSWYIFL